jgi:hypothetical protein
VSVAAYEYAAATLAAGPSSGSEPCIGVSQSAGLAERADGRDAKGRFAPRNKSGETHGALTFTRRGGELPPEFRLEHERFKSQVFADLGGELSEIELGFVELLCATKSILNLLAADMQRSGMMTPRGRLRATYAAWLKASSRYEKLASKLGLKRRAKPAQTLDSYLAERTAAEERK